MYQGDDLETSMKSEEEGQYESKRGTTELVELTVTRNFSIEFTGFRNRLSRVETSNKEETWMS